MRKVFLFLLLWGVLCLANQNCVLTQLKSYAEAEAFATCVQDKVRKNTSLADKQVELHLFHLDSEKKINRYLEWGLKILAEKGFKLHGDYVTETELEKLIQTSEEFPPLNPIQPFAFASQGWNPNLEENLLQFPSRTSLGKTIGRNLRIALHKTLQLPASGFTFFSHFVVRDPQTGKLKRKFETIPGISRFARKNAMIGVLWLAGIQLGLRNILNGPKSINDFFQYAYEHTDTGFLALSSALSAWIYTTLYFSKSLYSFRRQTSKITQNPNLPNGHQISDNANSIAFLANCILQDIFWAQIIFGLQTQTGTGQWTTEGAMAYIKTSFFSGASYAGMEQLRGKILEEASQVEKENPDLAAELRKKAMAKGTAFWSFLYPLAFNTALFIPGDFSSIPLLGLAIYGLARGKKDAPPLTPLSFKEEWLALPTSEISPTLPLVYQGCTDLLLLNVK